MRIVFGLLIVIALAAICIALYENWLIVSDGSKPRSGEDRNSPTKRQEKRSFLIRERQPCCSSLCECTISLTTAF